MNRKITCVMCPVGCRITVEMNGDEPVISGNRCTRGRQYVIDELIKPKRVLTTSVKVKDGDLPLVSVKTSGPIEKKIIMDKMKEIKKKTVEAPVKIGEIIITNIDGNGVDLLATRKVKKIHR